MENGVVRKVGSGLWCWPSWPSSAMIWPKLATYYQIFGAKGLVGRSFTLPYLDIRCQSFPDPSRFWWLTSFGPLSHPFATFSFAFFCILLPYGRSIEKLRRTLTRKKRLEFAEPWLIDAHWKGRRQGMNRRKTGKQWNILRENVLVQDIPGLWNIMDIRYG